MSASDHLNFLIADDSVLDRSLLLAYIQSHNWSAISVFDGAAAVQQAQVERFDAMIFDFNMPHLNGLEAIRQIRQAGPNMDTPCLLCTAGSTRQIEAQLSGAENVELFRKPLLHRAFVSWSSRLRSQFAAPYGRMAMA